MKLPIMIMKTKKTAGHLFIRDQIRLPAIQGSHVLEEDAVPIIICQQDKYGDHGIEEVVEVEPGGGIIKLNIVGIELHSQQGTYDHEQQDQNGEVSNLQDGGGYGEEKGAQSKPGSGQSQNSEETESSECCYDSYSCRLLVDKGENAIYK